jgi:hypothetical protein
MMTYPSALNDNLPIGSGVTEAACKMERLSARLTSSAVPRERRLKPESGIYTLFASPPSAAEAEDLQLTVGEIRPWQ